MSTLTALAWAISLFSQPVPSQALPDVPEHYTRCDAWSCERGDRCGWYECECLDFRVVLP